MNKSNLNSAPFFDDYDEKKGFHQVLFKPRPVQTRELNQMQTILQKQISRLGNHIFKDGSIVGEGSISIKENQAIIKVTTPFVFDNSWFNINQSPIHVKSVSAGLRAKVLTSVTDSTGSLWLAVEYLNSDGDMKQAFEANEALTVSNEIDGVDVQVTNATVSDVSTGFYVGVLAGVYYIHGAFVLTDGQSLLIPIAAPNKLVGFRVTEEVIDETQDVSLYSNASGEPNFKGAGAARLKISLQLEAIDQEDKDSDFIEIVRVRNGEVESKVDTSQYATLNEVLAQRTYEESGDYTVSQYPISLFEHLRSGSTPDGLNNLEEGGREDQYVVRLGRGVAYVRGFRQEIQSYKDIAVDKARDINIINNGIVQAQYGSFVFVNLDRGLPKLDLNRLHSIVTDSNQVLGTTKIRAMKREGENSAMLYLMDIQLNPGASFSNAAKIVGSFSGNDIFEATLQAPTIYGGTTDSLVFALPYTNVKSLTGTGGQDVTYTVNRSFDVSLDSNGRASISLSGSEMFNSVNQFDYFVSVNGQQVQLPVSGLSLSGNPVGKVLNIDYGSTYGSNNLRLIANISKTNPTAKTKTLRTAQENISFNDSSSIKLSNADIFRIVEIINIETGANITAGFNFFDGQRPNWYEVGELFHTAGTLTANLSITYEYFEHSTSGDFFCVDSYPVDINEIPNTKEASDRVTRTLADCIDFRPLKGQDETFINLPTNFDVINPDDNLRFDLTYYLPRIDIVYVSGTGNYGVVKGISSEDPKAPVVPADALGLYQLHVPAFTSDVNGIRSIELESRRYTMSDIGKLEKRIENLEYYATLSQLEMKTERTQVLDPITGNNRFKNGILADGFTDFRLIDMMDDEWAASIDNMLGEVTAPLIQNGVDVEYVSGGQKGKSVVTLPYTLERMAYQPYATTTSNINPFAVFSWVGGVTLTPAQDFWRDTVFNKPTVINITNDLTGGAKAGDVLVGTKIETSQVGERWWMNSHWRINRQTTTTQTLMNTKITESVDVKINDTRISLEVLPFMRGTEIRFDLAGFKPLTRLYPFFSGIAVSTQCKQDGKEYGEAIVVDEFGAASGVYKAPTSKDFRFPNGTNVLRFSDDPKNGDDPNASRSTGEATFISGGELETVHRTSTYTKTLRAVQTKWTNSFSTTKVVNIDPVAQTFTVGKAKGAFIKRVEVFFSTKAKSIPVKLQLRTTVAGVPSGEVMTFGEVVLNPSQVQVSDDGTKGTIFEFQDAIYLEPETEYAIVLMADTQEYNVYLARMGELDLATNYVVAKQPHTGVFLVSSNSTSWTINQMEDLKFNVFGCKFTSREATVVLRGKGTELRNLPYNALSSTVSSTTVTVYCPGHGLKVGDNITISGAEQGNGFTSEMLNKTHKVASRKVDSVDLVLSASAAVSGSFGGGNTMVKVNAPFAAVSPWFGSLALDGCSLETTLRYTAQGTRTEVTVGGLDVDAMNQLPVEGVVLPSKNPELVVTLRSEDDYLTPLLDTDGAGLELIGYRISTDEQNVVAKAITSSVKFDNPSTSAKLFLVGHIPFGASVKLKYKPIINGDDNLTNKEWVEAKVVKNFKQSSTDTFEAEYEISGIGAFLGFKLCMEMFADDPVARPILKELRGIALA